MNPELPNAITFTLTRFLLLYTETLRYIFAHSTCSDELEYAVRSFVYACVMEMERGAASSPAKLCPPPKKRSAIIKNCCSRSCSNFLLVQRGKLVLQ